jgi:hypothetical protein
MSGSREGVCKRDMRMVGIYMGMGIEVGVLGAFEVK